MSKRHRVLAAAALTALLAGCELLSPDEPPTLELAAPTTAIAASEVVVTVTLGDDHGLTRLALAWGDGAADTVSLSGTSGTQELAHAFATLGAFMVEARVWDDDGQEAATAGTVTVEPGSIAIEPAADTLNAFGFTTQLTATAYDADGGLLDGFVPEWESLDPDLASVSAAGVVTAVGRGTARIRVASGQAAGEAAVLVRQVPATVVLTAPDTLGVRERATLSVTATDSNDVGIAEPVIAWASLEPAVAAMTTPGAVEGAGEGSARVVASAGHVADTAGIEVALALLFVAPPEAGNPYTDVFTMTRHGTERRTISTYDFGDLGGTWSPDRTRIAFVSLREPAAITIANADGSGHVAVPTGLTQPPNDLAWAPDGERIAFSTIDDDAGAVQIYVIAADGTGLTKLTADPAENRHPAWSPDGTRIAFSRFLHGEGTVTIDVLVMDANGANVVNLTDGVSGGHYAPVWSPDGTEIAFTSGFSDPSRNLIHRMHADGSNVRVIGAHHVTQLDWSLDGALFLFATEHVDGQRDVFSMPAEGGDVTRITNDALWEQDVRWR